MNLNRYLYVLIGFFALLFLIVLLWLKLSWDKSYLELEFGGLSRLILGIYFFPALGLLVGAILLLFLILLFFGIKKEQKKINKK